MIPAWQKFNRATLDDGKFNAELVPPMYSGTKDYWPPAFPGYIDNEEHPFGYSSSLYLDNGVPNKNWSIGESPQLFEENKKKMSGDWKYLTKKVEYNVNASGYRTRNWKDINWKGSIVIFGDSCTFGSGLAEDETISAVLERKLGRPVINMGAPGCSNHQIVNNCSTLINKFDVPCAVIINWSTSDRFRYYYKNGYHDVGPWDSNNAGEPIDGVDISKLWLSTYMDRYNELCTTYYLSRTAEALWKNRTKYITISYFDYIAHYTRADQFFKIKNTARDLVHPGYENSLEVAEYLKCKLQE